LQVSAFHLAAGYTYCAELLRSKVQVRGERWERDWKRKGNEGQIGEKRK
jgi:hypothetical protein